MPLCDRCKDDAEVQSRDTSTELGLKLWRVGVTAYIAIDFTSLLIEAAP